MGWNNDEPGHDIELPGCAETVLRWLGRLLLVALLIAVILSYWAYAR